VGVLSHSRFAVLFIKQSSKNRLKKELSCVDTTDIIFSCVKKEILGMKDKNSLTRQHRFTNGKTFRHRFGSSPPFQELKEGFDDWVRKLRFILQIPKKLFIIPNLRKKVKQKRDQKCDAEPPSKGGISSDVPGDCREKHR
jgi:hypothetical protein